MHFTALLLLGFTGTQLTTALPVPAEGVPALANVPNIPSPQSAAPETPRTPQLNVPSSPPTNPALPGNPASVTPTDALAHRSEDVKVPNVDLEEGKTVAARFGPDPEAVQRAHPNDGDDNNNNNNNNNNNGDGGRN